MLVQHGELSARLCARAGFSFGLERQILVKSTNLTVNRCYTQGYLLQAMSFLITLCAKARNLTKPARRRLRTPRVWGKRTMPLPPLRWSFALRCLEIGFERIGKALSNAAATPIFLLHKYSAKGSEKPKLCSLRNKVVLEFTHCKGKVPSPEPPSPLQKHEILSLKAAQGPGMCDTKNSNPSHASRTAFLRVL